MAVGTGGFDSKCRGEARNGRAVENLFFCRVQSHRMAVHRVGAAVWGFDKAYGDLLAML